MPTGYGITYVSHFYEVVSKDSFFSVHGPIKPEYFLDIFTWPMDCPVKIY